MFLCEYTSSCVCVNRFEGKMNCIDYENSLKYAFACQGRGNDQDQKSSLSVRKKRNPK